MNFYDQIYNKTLNENERNLRFWEDYLRNLKELDFSVYSKKLKVPVLVPVGSRLLFRGELKHTNEVTVSLGADYFAKCSLDQAEVLRKKRIKDAEAKVSVFKKEREYLENQMSFTRNIFEDRGQDIVEPYNEINDKQWREQHRENVRKHKQNNNKGTVNEVTDEELWNRLEELELQEELENEMNSNTTEDVPIDFNREDKTSYYDTESQSKDDIETNHETVPKPGEGPIPMSDTHKDMLQKVLDKQDQLLEKLHDLKNRERGQSKTENDILSRLEEMEELEELEDEMERLEDILQIEQTESQENEPEKLDSHARFTVEKVDSEEVVDAKLKKTKRIRFADEDDGETLEITFEHSNVEPDDEQYDPDKGIRKPSDVYKAYPNSFKETTSILKKSKYKSSVEYKETKEVDIDQEISNSSSRFTKEPINETIVVNDVVERTGGANSIDMSVRPTSLFKMRRQQRNS